MHRSRRGGDATTPSLRVRGAVMGASLAFGLVSALAVTGSSSVAGALTTTQSNVGSNVNCSVNGLHQGAGPVSTCRDISITTELLVNGADTAAGANLFAGDVVTVRLTVAAEGGDNSFYEETSDGIRNGESGGVSDIQAYFDVGLPTQTGTQLSSPANVKMSRTDNGDRGNGPAINCLTQAGQEAAVTDGLTAITVGAAEVGGTKMKAAVSGTTLRGTWNDMAWDRCRAVTFNNAVYPGHVLEFTQTVLSHTMSNQSLTWNLGQFTAARDDASRSITWGANSNTIFNVPGDADGDGILDTSDPAPNDACTPDNTVGACDRDGDGEINSVDTDDTDPCEDSGGITSFPGCDDDGDGIPDGSVTGSNGIAGVNGGALDSNADNPCFPNSSSTECVNNGSRFVKLSPLRIMDTRIGLGSPTAPIGVASSRDLTVAGVNGVPATATAVVLNVTATAGTATTFITVWPAGVARPNASNINVKAGVNRPNLVLATVGADGKISIYNNAGTTHIVVDIAGYFDATTGDGYSPLTPKRVMDTREGIGSPASDFTAGLVRDLTIGGANGVPASATAAIVNITAVNGTATSFITAYPKGVTRPTASNVNWTAGSTSPNMAVVPLGTGGAISLFNNRGNVDILVDVVGYFDASATGHYRPLTPVRFFDSRTGAGTVGGDWASGEARAQAIRGAVVPMVATGFAGNLTAPIPAANSFFTLWPDGLTRPVVSNLNVVAGETRANSVIGGIGSTGAVKIYSYSGGNHLLLDVSGWFGPIAGL